MRARERERARERSREREREEGVRGARHGASAIHTAGQSIWGHSKVKQKPMGVIDDHGNWIRTSVQENLGFCASTAAVVEVKSIGSPVPEFWLVDVDHDRLQHSFPSCSVLAGSSKTVRQRVDEARGTCTACSAITMKFTRASVAMGHRCVSSMQCPWRSFVEPHRWPDLDVGLNAPAKRCRRS